MKKLQNVFMIESQNRLIKQEILFDETSILDQGERLSVDVEETIDGQGALLLPGLIDVHVHLRDPGFTQKETIGTGTKAAAHGGFTTILAMPNVEPSPDNLQQMKKYIARINENAVVHVYPYGTITQGERGEKLSDMEAMALLGVSWFSDDGAGVQEESLMRQAMERCKRLGCMIVAHTEDLHYRKPGACLHEGRKSREMGLTGIPSACEYKQLERDLQLALETGCRYHACHISCKESVSLLKKYKEKGADVSAEVTAHHLVLQESDVKGTHYKMNPPLRTEEDREALIQGLKEGTLDFIASDHAPHTEEEKKQGMEKAPFGIVSLETSFPVLYTELVKSGRFTLQQLVAWMSEKPARRFGFTRKGMLCKGMDSDFILVHLDDPFQIQAKNFYSKGRNTPFDGKLCYGQIVRTVVSGKTVYEKGGRMDVST